MTTWNYRVIRTIGGKGTTHWHNYGLAEVYYDAKGRIEGWTESPCEPSGGSLGELRRDLAHMRLALTRPVLEERKGKLVEVKEGRDE